MSLLAQSMGSKSTGGGLNIWGVNVGGSGGSSSSSISSSSIVDSYINRSSAGSTPYPFTPTGTPADLFISADQRNQVVSNLGKTPAQIAADQAQAAQRQAREKAGQGAIDFWQKAPAIQAAQPTVDINPLLASLGLGLQSAADTANETYQRLVNTYAMKNLAYDQAYATAKKINDLDVKRIGLDVDINDIQKEYIGKYRTNIWDQLNAERQKLFIEEGRLDSQDAFLRGERDRTKDLFAKEMKFLNEKEWDDFIQHRGDAAAMGADTSYGTMRAWSGVVKGNQLTRDKMQSADDSDEAKFRLALKDLGASRAKIHQDLDLVGISAREAHQKLDERERILDKEAKKLGIDRDKLVAQMEDKLAQLNLNKAITAGQIAEAAASRDRDIARAAQEFINSSNIIKATVPGK